MPADLPQGFRSLNFLDGTKFMVSDDTCRGCWMNQREDILPDLLEPVYDDGVITVRQDAEWAVPGFMVVAVRPHVGALDQMDGALVTRIANVMRVVRAGMRRALGLETVQMYQEEKLDRPHFHVWMLPLWPDVMAAQGINPRIYESNIAEYLRLFDLAHHEGAVRDCVEKLRHFVRGEDVQAQIAEGSPRPCA